MIPPYAGVAPLAWTPGARLVRCFIVRSLALVLLSSAVAGALVPACAAIPELSFRNEADGGDATAPPGDDAASDGSPNPGDAANDTSSDAPHESSSGGCSGAGACCSGHRPCIDRPNKGNSAPCDPFALQPL